MILVDYQIRNLCQLQRPMVSPFDESLVNPASLDVRLGSNLLIESAERPELVPYPLAGCSEANPYELVPGQFVLAQTLETFDIPRDIAAEFKLKSSRAREGLDHALVSWHLINWIWRGEGLDHALAGWCDPGWHGSVLTLELRNNRQLWPIPIWPGMKIGQIIFHRLDAVPQRCYAESGRYNGDATVMGSKG
jgi:dCTP deaminase